MAFDLNVIRSLSTERYSIGSKLSVASIDSTLSAYSILSIGSVGSFLSIGSAGSILSIGSAGSILSVGSAGSILSSHSAGNILCSNDQKVSPDALARRRFGAASGVAGAALLVGAVRRAIAATS